MSPIPPFLRTTARRIAQCIPKVAGTMTTQHKDRPTPQFVPPGHFYSPIPSLDEVQRDHVRIFGSPPRSLVGIALNESRQLELLGEFRPYYAELSFPERKTPGHRYFYENSYYSYSDAILLYCMIRHLQPKRLIEIGSGHSSCVTLDTNERFFGGSIQCTFIEPYPDRLLSLLSPDDRPRIEIVQQRLQDVPLDRFRELQARDILFIDSTHVAKIGSDVNHILSEVLPNLKPDVYIHFHDIFYPFEYPPDWVYAGRAWTEAYMLRAFLAFSTAFEIVLFNTFLEYFYRDEFEQHMPLCLRNPGGSLWVRRRSSAYADGMIPCAPGG